MAVVQVSALSVSRLIKHAILVFSVIPSWLEKYRKRSMKPLHEAWLFVWINWMWWSRLKGCHHSSLLGCQYVGKLSFLEVDYICCCCSLTKWLWEVRACRHSWKPVASMCWQSILSGDGDSCSLYFFNRKRNPKCKAESESRNRQKSGDVKTEFSGQ